LDRTLWSPGQGARLVTVREPEDGQLHRETELLVRTEQEGSGNFEGAHRAGKITPVIDRTYSLSETPEAIRYLEEGHARGKVVVTASASGRTDSAVDQPDHA
jgi:NADPH:quinone reductase-like Zn-dependent oxidoreductase